jgi:hypothetical protein
MPFHIRPFLTLPLAFWFLITLLVLRSEPASAEWVEYGGNAQTGITVYLDPDTIRRKGDLVKMWSLDDYKAVRTVEGTSFFSSKRQTLFDCVEERHRILAFTNFSGNMGDGKVVFSDSPESEWHPVEPGSITEGLWKFACGKE